MGDKRSFLDRLKRYRGIGWMAVLAAAGIFLIVVGGQIGKHTESYDESKTEDPYGLVRSYTEELEGRIEALCVQIDGVTKAHVLLSLDGSTEQVYAENTAGSSVDYVIIEGKEGESALLVQEIYPQVRGIAVVCTRGDDSEIQRTVTELLAAALGIPTSRIRVAGT